jgi:hypothetical protein
VRRLIVILFAGLVAVPGSAPVAPPRVAPPPDPESVHAGPGPLPSDAELATLARTDPIGFLRACVRRYRAEVRGFTAVLQKQEFIGGRLGPVEVVEVAFRDEPHSVLLRWRTEPSARADRALYVEAANGGQMLVRPKGKAARLLTGGVVARPPDGPDARAAGRYTLPEFGLRKATERTLAAWAAAQRRGALKAEYLGVRSVPEAGGVACHVLRRTCDPPEEDDIAAVEVAFDVDNWLQVANVLTAPGGRLVAAYYFRDVKLNPDFPPGQFDRAALLTE